LTWKKSSLSEGYEGKSKNTGMGINTAKKVKKGNKHYFKKGVGSWEERGSRSVRRKKKK